MKPAWLLAALTVPTLAAALLCAACGSFRNGGGAADGGGTAEGGEGGTGGDARADAGASADSGAGADAGADAITTADGPVADVQPGEAGCTVACTGTNTQALLFGGFEGVRYGDTWTFGGVAWQSFDGGAAPTARSGAVAAPLHGTVVLFGGQDEKLDDLAETWIWDGAAWTKSAASGPPGRVNAGIATLGDEVVLFGGDGDGGPVGDTWSWDGAAWTQRSGTGPSARQGAAMAARGSEVVLFGGRDTSFDDLADTWTWDGTKWTLRTPAHSPSAREFGAAATVTATQGTTVVLFGGEFGATLADTWTWDGTDWTEQSPASPPSARESPGMATLGGQAVLFGGWDGAATYYDDTWLWDGTSWTPVSTEGPSFRALVAMSGP